MITRYVNTASSAGGDGTTNATTGANRAYATLNEAEASEQCVLADTIEFICEGTAADSTIVTFSGWTTTSSYTINIRTTQANRHDGKWNTEKYRLVDSNYSPIVTLDESHVTVDGLQIENTRNTSGGGTLKINAVAGIYIENTIIRSSPLTGARTVEATSSSTVATFINCIVYNPHVTANSYRGFYLRCSSATLYNCTIYNFNGIGVYRNTGTVTSTNCVSFSNGDDFSGGTQTFCASDDGDGTDAVHWTGGATDWANVFEDYANDDFHLKNFSGTGAIIGQGTDNPGSGLYSDDIDGDTRTSVWDIGADEYVASGTVYQQATAGSMPNSVASVVAVSIFGQMVVGAAPNPAAVIVRQVGVQRVGIMPTPVAIVPKEISKQFTGEHPAPVGDVAYSSVYNQSVTGDSPFPVGSLSSILLMLLTLVGDMPASLGGIAKRIGKKLFGDTPASGGVTAKQTNKNITGEMPPSMGGVFNTTRIFLSGVMGTIVGVLSTLLNPIPETITKLCKLIGGCFKKLIG